MSEKTTSPALAAAQAALEEHLETAHMGPRLLGVRCKTCVALRRSIQAVQHPGVPHPRRTATMRFGRAR